MKRKLLIVLYFVNGPIASEAELDEIGQYGQGYIVRQRNAQMIHSDECMEAFDIVAGAVPNNYADKYAEQGEPVLPESKRISAEGVAEGSPVAPPQSSETGNAGASGAAEPGNAPGGAKTAAGAGAKPKEPTPKPDAGWKPNA